MASAGDAPRERLFFALWPDATLRRRLARTAPGAGRDAGRPVPTGNLHLTLLFLGAVDAAQRTCVETAAARLDTPSFDLVFDHLGYFARPQVVFIGCHTPPPALLELSAGLLGAAGGCGVHTDERPFRAHLTLRRHARHGPPPGPFEPIPWSVREFVLVRSRTGPEGAHYAIVQRWPLRPERDGTGLGTPNGSMK